MLALSVFLMVPVAAGVVGFFLDGIVDAVEARHYPGLPPARAAGPRPRRSATRCASSGWWWSANLVALVLYFAVPPLAPFVFWLVNGFLLGREYFTLVADPAARAATAPRRWGGGISGGSGSRASRWWCR